MVSTTNAESFLCVFSILVLKSGTFVPKQPKFLQDSGKLYTQLKGRTVDLECSVQNLGDGMIVWKQDDRVLFAGSIQVRRDLRMSLVGDHNFPQSNLRIRNTKPTDAGNYTCEVEWLGSPLQLTHPLQILEEPTIIEPAEGLEVQVREGDDFVLECTARGNPKPRIVWKRRLIKGKTIKTKKIGESLLSLEKVNQSFTGKYECRASNRIRTDSRIVYVQVNFAPSIVVNNPIIYSGPGGNAVLECRVRGFPQPSVTWFWISDGQEQLVMPDKNHVIAAGDMDFDIDDPYWSLHTLYMSALSHLELGNFTCFASNEIGTAGANIQIAGIPAPAAVSSSPQGRQPNFFVLLFSLQSHSPILQIQIKYKLNSTKHKGFWETRLLSPDSGFGVWSNHNENVYRNFEFPLHHLYPGEAYTVAIKSMNEYGWSDESLPFSFTTKQFDDSDRMKYQNSSCAWCFGLSVFIHCSLMQYILS